MCIVNFSGRQNGNCHDIARYIEQCLSAKHGGCEITLFEMCDLDITPCGKCGYECFDADAPCPYAADDMGDVYTALVQSDLVYFVVPNYINYPNAYFFAFSERKQGFFPHKTGLIEKYLDIAKKFVVVSNTEEDNFREILGRHVSERGYSDFLFLASKDFGKGGVRGGIIECEQAKMIIRGFC